jgi:hypothetical protein
MTHAGHHAAQCHRPGAADARFAVPEVIDAFEDEANRAERNQEVASR